MADGHTDVVIVGGGIAGLACGVALADRGLKVTLLEREARLGGRACSWTHAPTGDRIDIGPHVVLNEYGNFLGFLERLGTRDRITWQPRKLITIGTSQGALCLRHRPLPPPLSLLPDFLRAPGLAWRDFVSNNRPTWRAMTFTETDVEKLDHRTGLEYLAAAGVSEAMIDWFWKLATMAVMNTPLERVSAAAMLRVHGFMIGHRGLHFGFPAVGLGDLYTEQARAAIESAGGSVRLASRVTAVGSADGRHRVTCGDEAFTAAHCVLALPPAELGALLPGIAAAGAFEPSPYISTYLWFDRRVVDECFWALLWSPTRLNYDFYDLARIRPQWRGRGSVLACNLIYSHRAHALTDEAIVGATLREIAEFAPAVREAKLLHADVHRIPMAIALPAAGTESKRPETRTALPGLFLAGDWTRTGMPSSMEGAAFSGYRAAEALLLDLGRSARLAQPLREPDGLARLARKATCAWRGSPRSRP